MVRIGVPGLRLVALAAAFAVAAGVSPGRASEDPKIDTAAIKLPPGFAIEVFATVPHARSMAVAEGLQAVFVGTDDDKVYALIDRNRDHKVDETLEIAGGLKRPTSVAFKDGRLFVVTQERVLAYDIGKLAAGEKYPAQVLRDNLPVAEAYSTRHAVVGPDGKLYVSVSAPCDVCKVHGVEATIVRMNTDGTGEEIFASGVRSSAGMDFHREESGQTAWYFTDDGADDMDGTGTDLPPDELNNAWRAGLNFGFPWYGGAGVKSPEYQSEPPPADAQMPVIRFAPNSTPMGIHFYRGKMFPRPYRGDLFVAEHGSADRAEPLGARILRIHFDEDRPVSTEVFAGGWLQDSGPWGRPTDIQELGDGSLLISDDQAGVIYRVTYTGS